MDRIPLALVVPIALSATAFGLLLYLDAGIGFRLDDWYIVANRSVWSVGSLLQPVNEHWFALTLVIFDADFSLFGLHSAYPYLVALTAVHVGAGFVLYMLIAERSGWKLAVCAMVMFLFVGQGAESLFWADQVSFAGSTLAGLGALLLLRHDRFASGFGAGLLLLASLMFSGAGLLYMFVVAGQLALDRRWRRLGVSLAVPVLVYGAWFLVYGRTAPQFRASAFSSGSLQLRLPLSIVLGTAQSLTRVLELPIMAIVPVLAGAVIVLRHAVLRDRLVPSEAIPPLLAPLVFFTLAAIERPTFSAAVSRYVYVCAPFWLLGLASVTRSLWRPRLGPALAAGVVALTFVNGIVLAGAAADHRRETRSHLAVLATVERARYCRDFTGNVEFSPDVAPGVLANQYLAAVDRLGSPVPTDMLALPAQESPESRAVLSRVLASGQIADRSGSPRHCAVAASPLASRG